MTSSPVMALAAEIIPKKAGERDCAHCGFVGPAYAFRAAALCIPCFELEAEEASLVVDGFLRETRNRVRAQLHALSMRGVDVADRFPFTVAVVGYSA